MANFVWSPFKFALNNLTSGDKYDIYLKKGSEAQQSAFTLWQCVTRPIASSKKRSTILPSYTPPSSPVNGHLPEEWTECYSIFSKTPAHVEEAN